MKSLIDIGHQRYYRRSVSSTSASTPYASFSTTARTLNVDPKVRTPASPSGATAIPPEGVPKPPHSPATQTSPGSAVPPPEHPPTTKPSTVPPPPPPPPPPAPKKKSGFRGFLVRLFITAGLAYAGGVWLSLKSDNFHDFFTEYIPLGEEAVLYAEEWDFQRRFPNAAKQIARRPIEEQTHEVGENVVIPSKSGLSWKTAEEKDGTDVSRRGKHMSALDENKPKESKREDKGQPEHVEKPTKKEATEKVTAAKKEAKSPALEDQREPLLPARNVEPLVVADSTDPAVQDLVRIVNDLITVANAGDGKELAAPLQKAKDEFVRLANDILAVRTEAQAEAQAEIEKAHKQFDTLATELVQRIDQVRTDEAAQYREEFEAEREKLALSYQEKIKTELERAHEVAEQRLRNELMEQAIEMNRQFLADVRELVEKEREGRLSKLDELSSDVSQLEQLTLDWNTVIDSNLKTQQLQVAVDAVRAALENSDVPRPFLNELVAVKELADSDPVVAAAIASISPVAYQDGIPSSSQLVDRFRRVASEVRKASLLPENAGITSHIVSYMLSKATFKKQVSTAGDDVESVLTRTENYLEEGNLDDAAREMNSLQGWARLLSKDWLADVRRVLEVRQALEVCSTPTIIRRSRHANCRNRSSKPRPVCGVFRSSKDRLE